MGNVLMEMESICADIANSHAERNRSLKDLQKDVKALRDDSRKFVADSRRLHQEMAKSLNETLEKDREDLTKEVDYLRRDFRKSQKGVRSDLAAASKTWDEMCKTLKGKNAK
jgi:malate synthase